MCHSSVRDSATAKAHLDQPRVPVKEENMGSDSLSVVAQSVPVASTSIVDCVTGSGDTPSGRTFKPRKKPGEPRRKNTMDENIRRAKLANDKWVKDFTATSATCRGCGKTIALDKRNAAYYPGLWNKHRATCKKIKELETASAALLEMKTEAPHTELSQHIIIDTVMSVPAVSESDTAVSSELQAQHGTDTMMIVDDGKLEWEKSHVPFDVAHTPNSK